MHWPLPNNHGPFCGPEKKSLAACLGKMEGVEEVQLTLHMSEEDTCLTAIFANLLYIVLAFPSQATSAARDSCMLLLLGGGQTSNTQLTATPWAGQRVAMHELLSQAGDATDWPEDKQNDNRNVQGGQAP